MWLVVLRKVSYGEASNVHFMSERDVSVDW